MSYFDEMMNSIQREMTPEVIENLGHNQSLVYYFDTDIILATKDDKSRHIKVSVFSNDTLMYLDLENEFKHALDYNDYNEAVKLYQAIKTDYKNGSIDTNTVTIVEKPNSESIAIFFIEPSLNSKSEKLTMVRIGKNFQKFIN